MGLAINGDANDDGKVDMQDLAIVGANWLKPATNWAMGDLNDDGVVNAQDLQMVENGWDGAGSFSSAFATLQGQGEFPGVVLVPEPSTLAALAMAPVALLLKRRRPRGLKGRG